MLNLSSSLLSQRYKMASLLLPISAADDNPKAFVSLLTRRPQLRRYKEMGVPFSLLGLPSVDKLATDKVFDLFKDVKNPDEFHQHFIEFCSQFNKIMPGKHYIIKTDAQEIENFFKDEWNKEKEDDKRKKLLVEFMKGKVEIYRANSTLMIATGCVAPAAAIMLKRSGEKVPQLKKLRIDLVPNFVIVPGITLLSLIGVRMFGLSKATSDLSNKNPNPAK